MKYYTKEWYGLMGSSDMTDGLTVVADKDYSDSEIEEFYQNDLAEEIERDRKFQSSNFSAFFGGLDLGSLFSGKDGSVDEFGGDNTRFDSSDTERSFRNSYENMLKFGIGHYPQWVRDEVDNRLLALWRMPKAALERLREEELQNRLDFERINRLAVLEEEKQNIPPEFHEHFHCHDANVLKFASDNGDIAIFISKDGYVDPGESPYEKILFHNAVFKEFEDPGTICFGTSGDGTVNSNCVYLYDELYSTEQGYEIHMMFWVDGDLKYCTVACSDVTFESLEAGTIT